MRGVGVWWGGGGRGYAQRRRGVWRGVGEGTLGPRTCEVWRGPQERAVLGSRGKVLGGGGGVVGGAGAGAGGGGGGGGGGGVETFGEKEVSRLPGPPLATTPTTHTCKQMGGPTQGREF